MRLWRSRRRATSRASTSWSRCSASSSFRLDSARTTCTWANLVSAWIDFSSILATISRASASCFCAACRTPDSSAWTSFKAFSSCLQHNDTTILLLLSYILMKVRGSSSQWAELVTCLSLSWFVIKIRRVNCELREQAIIQYIIY